MMPINPKYVPLSPDKIWGDVELGTFNDPFAVEALTEEDVDRLQSA